MKNPANASNKFNFNWKNVAPSAAGIEWSVADLYKNKIIFGYKNGVAVNILDQPNNPWRFVTKTEDGIPIRNITSVAAVDENVSVFSDGNGYYIDDGKTTLKRTSANSMLPGDNVSRMKVALFREGRKMQEFFACTDKGLYLDLYNSEDLDFKRVYTTADGLPSNKVLDVAGNGNLIVVITDKGAALGKTSIPIEKFTPFTIHFMDNEKLLFVEIDYKDSREQLDSTDDKIIIATSNRVALSNNGGIDWKDITPTESERYKINCVYAFDNGLYVGTDNGLFVSGTDGKVWRNYTTKDGLSDNNITSISIDADAEAIIVATSGGINQGDFFSWSVSTIQGAGTVYCLAESFDYQRKHVVFFAATDKGLFQSLDSCVSWENVYEKKPVYSVQAHNFSEVLFVGTVGEGILVYPRPYEGIKNKSPRIINTSNGLLHNSISQIALDASDAFATKAFVSYADGDLGGGYGLSYTNDINDDTANAWNTFDEKNNIPDDEYFSLKVIDKKVFCCAVSGFLAISDQLSIGLDCKNLKFSLPLSGLASFDDVAKVAGKFFVSLHRDIGGETLPGDILESDDLSEWRYLDSYNFWGVGTMNGNNSDLYVYELDSLICYSIKNDTQLTYPLPKGDSEDWGQIPLISGEKIYLPSDNGRIFISELSSLI